MLRIGQGFDIHPLVKNRDLIIGGVKIPNALNLGLLGTSDADVLIHALIDSLVGACALGDIGTWLSLDRNIDLKNIDSRILLKDTLKKINLLGHNIEIYNIDSTIIIENPKMSPHILNMRQNIADDLKISIDQINIKAKTNDSLDSIGQNLAASALVSILLDDKK